MTDKLEIRGVLDGLGHGVLIFATDGKLVNDNLAARRILGTDIKMLQDTGWEAASALFNIDPHETRQSLNEVRDEALKSDRPIRFHIVRAGEYIPCRAAALTIKDGSVYTMLTLEEPDWSMVSNVIDRFRTEIDDAVNSTVGHINLIEKTLKSHKPEAGFDVLSKRLSGFTRLIAVHMSRAERLLTMMERLSMIRTGAIRETIRKERKKIDLEDYLEDFLEELDEISLLDPETEQQDYRLRISTSIPTGMYVATSRRYLTYILQDMLRNAIMYSLRGTPIKINVHQKNQNIQIDLVDEGYGVRQKEWGRVFDAFQRARQPQIISEFGYGLSLYLGKNEIESMNGQMWFTSEEGVGSTFSFTLPVWQDEAAPASSSDKSDKPET